MKNLVFLFVLLFSLNTYADPCMDLVKALIAKKKDMPSLEHTSELVKRLKNFADENALPYQILEVGPSNRKVQKLFVGLDATDEALVERYLKEFNLEDTKKPTLALEFGFEVPDEYVLSLIHI